MVESTSVETTQIKIGLIGATGAIGKEIMDYIKTDTRISEIVILCRKADDAWKEWTPKVTAIERAEFLNVSKEEDSEMRCAFEGVDIFLCTLGTRVKVGDELFKRVDYEYPLEFARLCRAVQGKHFGLLSSVGANQKSMMLYTRTKGEVERDAELMDLTSLTIYQPGLLLNRRNDDRFGEKIGAYIPFMPKVEARIMGECMVNQGIEQVSEPVKLLRLTNDEIKQIHALQ